MNKNEMCARVYFRTNDVADVVENGKRHRTTSGMRNSCSYVIAVFRIQFLSGFGFFTAHCISLFFQYNLDRTLLMLSNVYGWRLWNSLSFHSIESERKKYSTLIGSSTGAILSIQR